MEIDQAGNNELTLKIDAVRLLGNRHFPCFAHGLNVSAFQDENDILTRGGSRTVENRGALQDRDLRPRGRFLAASTGEEGKRNQERRTTKPLTH